MHNFNQGAIGKFIALYGLDDLIGNLPDTLEEFQIQNRDNNNNIQMFIVSNKEDFKDSIKHTEIKLINASSNNSFFIIESILPCIDSSSE